MTYYPIICPHAHILAGSIPERDEDGKLYNTSTVYSPTGELIATHRKVHLFDIDIPGQITFKVSHLPRCSVAPESYVPLRKARC